MRKDVERGFLRCEPAEVTGAFRAEFRFDPALPLFAGHFPGRPLLPGVLQLELVRFAAERHIGTLLDLNRVAKAKYRSPIGPGELILLEGVASQTDEGLRVRATVRADGRVAATMSLVLSPRE